MTTATKDNPLQAVEITKARKSPKEAEIDLRPATEADL